MDYSPEQLKRARELAGLTTKELAERAGIHPVTLNRLEGGLRPSEETWHKVEKALRKALTEAGAAIAVTLKQWR